MTDHFNVTKLVDSTEDILKDALEHEHEIEHCVIFTQNYDGRITIRYTQYCLERTLGMLELSKGIILRDFEIHD